MLLSVLDVGLYDLNDLFILLIKHALEELVGLFRHRRCQQVPWDAGHLQDLPSEVDRLYHFMVLYFSVQGVKCTDVTCKVQKELDPCFMLLLLVIFNCFPGTFVF